MNLEEESARWENKQAEAARDGPRLSDWYERYWERFFPDDHAAFFCACAAGIVIGAILLATVVTAVAYHAQNRVEI